MVQIDNSKSTLHILQDQSDLITWYEEHRRELPWRKNKDPYQIWISEVMLQQTTVAAVIPFYEKFMKRFPNLKTLSKAKESDVIEYWAGLGYYSRARNLHKAATQMAEGNFPGTAAELIQYPGFGPYTSRAVASLAFSEKVGVLDGNVIRVLSRRYGLELNWWNSKEKDVLQKISDQLAQTEKNSEMNQGLMELGATVCTPKKPICLLCPWKQRCVALKMNLVELLPRPKPRQVGEIWQWTVTPHIKKDKIFLTPLITSPFLKNVYFPESTLKKVSKKPKNFHIKHGVTKYDLYISVESPTAALSPALLKQGRWVKLDQVKQLNPTSLMTKILNFSKNNGNLKG